MLGLGTGELVIILAIVVLIFGANRLPKLGDGMGKALRGFKKAVSGDDDAPAKAEAAVPATITAAKPETDRLPPG